MTYHYATLTDLNHIRAGCFASATSWIPPNAGEVRLMLSALGHSPENFARIIGEPETTLRSWINGEQPIAYAVWCIMCLQAGFPPLWSQPPA
ncbi:hypothetical protein [Serratia ficaria]|uniref:hypothetical protein n=1 Tax=Serratia ficaria TaxID=61651 RepID=UPI00093E8916|nr:hypothetical protein [Serratia ficaria]